MMRYVKITLDNGQRFAVRVQIVGDPEEAFRNIYEYYESQGVDRENIIILGEEESWLEDTVQIFNHTIPIEDLLDAGQYHFRICLN